MNYECLAITFLTRTLPKPNGSPDIHFHREKLLPCGYKASQRIRQGDVSASENPGQEMQASCLLYDPLRDLAKEENIKKKKREKNGKLLKSQFKNTDTRVQGVQFCLAKNESKSY